MIRYALKTWKKIAFPALLFWIAAVYLWGFGIYMGRKLYLEKNEFCQLHVTSGDTDGIDLNVIGRIPGVASCTAVCEVNVVVTAAEYRADFCIQGVDSRFISGQLMEGRMFPESGGMPYLVMNEAALRSLSSDEDEIKDMEETKNADDLDDIESIKAADWLNGTVSLGTDSDHEIVAKICGIVRDDTETPAVYMSLDAAKDYVMRQGEIPVINSALVNLSSAGHAEDVMTVLGKLNYGVEGAESHFEEWRLAESQLSDCISSAVIATLATVALLRASIRMTAVLNNEKIKHRMAVNFMRSVIGMIYGLVIGVIILAIRLNV